MTKRLPQTLAAMCVTAALLSACGSLPPLERVTLTPPQTRRASAEPSDWTVRRVQVPEYLDNYDIQLRSKSYVLSRMDNAQWATRLPVAMTNLLQQSIDEKLVSHRDKPYVVHVSVDTFEPQPNGQVVLRGSWRVTDRADHVVARDTALIQEPLSQSERHDADDIGQAMSSAVRELAMQIVAQAG